MKQNYTTFTQDSAVPSVIVYLALRQLKGRQRRRSYLYPNRHITQQWRKDNVFTTSRRRRMPHVPAGITSIARFKHTAMCQNRIQADASSIASTVRLFSQQLVQVNKKHQSSALLAVIHRWWILLTKKLFPYHEVTMFPQFEDCPGSSLPHLVRKTSRLIYGSYAFPCAPAQSKWK